MRKLILVALAAAAVSVPVAFAAPGGTPTKPDKPTTPAASKPKPVAFIVRGVVKSTSGTDIVITVKSGNAHTKKALKTVIKDGTDFTVHTDAKTRFTKAGGGKTNFAAIAANDRVVVHYTVKIVKGARASADDMKAALEAAFAKKVTDQGPKPAA